MQNIDLKQVLKLLVVNNCVLHYVLWKNDASWLYR